MSSALLVGCAGHGSYGGYTGMGGWGMGGMGTEYGTGGMYQGTQLGGWGNGYGGDWGHTPSNPALADLDNDPHVTSSYRNPLFAGGRGVDYYHPATGGGGGNATP